MKKLKLKLATLEEDKELVEQYFMLRAQAGYPNELMPGDEKAGFLLAIDEGKVLGGLRLNEVKGNVTDTDESGKRYDGIPLDKVPNARLENMFPDCPDVRAYSALYADGIHTDEQLIQRSRSIVMYALLQAMPAHAGKRAGSIPEDFNAYEYLRERANPLHRTRPRTNKPSPEKQIEPDFADLVCDPLVPAELRGRNYDVVVILPSDPLAAEVKKFYEKKGIEVTEYRERTYSDHIGREKTKPLLAVVANPELRKYIPEELQNSGQTADAAIMACV